MEEAPESFQGIFSDLPSTREEQLGLEGYIHAFLQVWNRELEPDGEFRWHVVRPRNVPMLAIIFTTQEKGYALPEISPTDEEEWVRILKRCEEVLLRPVSKTVYFDNIVRAVTDTDIFIIKRNERRLWTRSMAREDAEATLLQAIHLQNEYSYGSGR